MDTEYVKEGDWVFEVDREGVRGSPVAMRIVKELQKREMELLRENQRLKLEVLYLKRAIREMHMELKEFQDELGHWGAGWVRIKSRPVNIRGRCLDGQEKEGN